MGLIEPSLVETEDTDNITCSICMQLLDTPMSPGGCQEGHTFCASCLRDALKAAPRCPTCRAASSPDALTRNRFAENEINGLRMRCAHGAAPPSAEPDSKRQKIVEHQKGAVVAASTPSSCSWRGKVAEYRAHLAECLFEPRAWLIVPTFCVGRRRQAETAGFGACVRKVCNRRISDDEHASPGRRALRWTKPVESNRSRWKL